MSELLERNTSTLPSIVEDKCIEENIDSSLGNRILKKFIQDYPRDATQKVESMRVEQAAAFIGSCDAELRRSMWSYFSPAFVSVCLLHLRDGLVVECFSQVSLTRAVNILSRCEEAQRERVLALVDRQSARELSELLSYPLASAGSIMDTRVLALHEDTSVANALKYLRTQPEELRRKVYTLNEEGELLGHVSLERLVGQDFNTPLKNVCDAVKYKVFVLDPKEEVAEKLQQSAIDILPVVDINQRLLGVIRGSRAVDTLKEDIAADLQSMVGASRDERALSSSWFAVKKRQGWLQINLLTGFLASAVVAMFEGTIAQFTALAVLMPIAAGQSGNTGAQALAVTMRGLTLREITTRHWLRVVVKEAGAGLMNGVAIAITCALGVGLWSQSVGLALIIALAMIISMTIAGAAGAMVPIVLKKLGQDPAQSSSIILTTVTDIAGFVSFLGIASSLSFLLR